MEENTQRHTEGVEERLTRLARFDALLADDNVVQGFSIWLRSSGVMLLVSVATVLLGLGRLFGDYLLLILIAVNIILLQAASSREARKRYGVAVLSSCWWSIVWRLFLYMFPVWVLITLFMPKDYLQDLERVMENPQPLLAAQLIYLVISILPTGVAASRAFLVSVRRLRLMQFPAPPPGDAGHDPGRPPDNGESLAENDATEDEPRSG